MTVLKEDILGLKSKLENIEKEFEGKLKYVENKEEKFKKLDEQLNDYLSNRDKVIQLNIGGKIFLTKISTLLSVKDTLFYNLLTTFIVNGGDIPKEFFFDRSYQYFPILLEYLRTKKFSLKPYNKYQKDDIRNELEFYGLAEVLNINKNEIYDIEWDQNLSKQGMCTVNQSDKRNIKIHTTTCYTYFITNKIFNSENFYIEFESTVTQSDFYYYLGIINESYNTTSNCMCCNPLNSYYIQCDGSIHINSVRTQEERFRWGGAKIIIGIKVFLQEKQIYFCRPDLDIEIGPYNLSIGNNWRVVAGHCNTGNGEITITECYGL